MTTQKKNVEIESTGAAGKSDFERVKKYFRLEVRACEVTSRSIYGRFDFVVGMIPDGH